MLWNELCDQGVEPSSFVARLREKDACLAIGSHDFYEIANSFRNSEKHARGRLLFSDFSQYLIAETLLIKDNMELLAHEMEASRLQLPFLTTTLSGKDRVLIVARAEQFANGELDEESARFLETQKSFADSTRTVQIAFLGGRPDIKGQLRLIPADQLSQWLDGETNSLVGTEILAHQIRRRFYDVSLIRAAQFAAVLLSKKMRFSMAIIRCDLYYNWRCANRESVPRDVIDDIYHILNAVYCDVYATAEAKQGKYAPLLLSNETQVAIYDKKTPIDEWLIEKLTEPKAF
jgi:hypothetical protein